MLKDEKQAGMERKGSFQITLTDEMVCAFCSQIVTYAVFPPPDRRARSAKFLMRCKEIRDRIAQLPKKGTFENPIELNGEEVQTLKSIFQQLDESYPNRRSMARYYLEKCREILEKAEQEAKQA